MTPPPTPPPSSDADRESREDRLVGILQACLEAIDNQTQALVDRACREHPEQAGAFRERIDALRAGGLVRFPESASAESFDWDTSSAAEASEASRLLEPVGPYQPLHELGRGGQAVVYLAEDQRLKRRVALKVLKRFGPVPESVLERFRREAEVASRLDHPGICAVYDAGVEGEVPYIAMQYVDGVTLAGRVAALREAAREDRGSSASRSEILEAVEIIEKTARALHAAHEAGVLHRDVKPRNIMVTPAGEPVLLDFGLAGSLTADEAGLTRTGEVFGTPAYMSPEQVRAGRQRLDRRTDVYSLGATLYECVTLGPPFDAPTRDAMYRAIQTREPVDPQKRNAEVPPDLRVVLQTALAKDRERRYPTALDLAEDLRRVREGSRSRRGR